MAAALVLHSSEKLCKTWVNRSFTVIYATLVSFLLFRHCRSILIQSPTTPISITLFLADFVLSFMWFTSQCFHWNPIQRRVFPENLRQVVSEREYPPLDVLICTADPTKEPPVGVLSTALSVLAYDYPTDKLSVYLSDDGGSQLTLYALLEGAKFAKHWIPFCKKHNIVDRSPEVYFETDPHTWFPETDEIKAVYERMKSKVEKVVQRGGVCLDDQESENFQDAFFSKWTPDFSRRHHPAVIQTLLDNHIDKDVAGGVMPNLVYVSREKSNDKPHNFKAGALNVLLRVSGLLSNGHIVLVLDCDMFSNDPVTPLRALCYFMDPNAVPKLGFVQFPQRFSGINKNDIYASEFRAETQILSLGMDGLLGVQFMGTAGFFKRHVISDTSCVGVTKGNMSSLVITKDVLASASCNYEDNTKWGSEIGFRYGTLTEDTYTSFRLHCEGWKSVLCNPKRAAFLGGSPTNLKDALTQIKRWYMGFLDIFFNKYSPITYGIRSMNPLHALCYTHYTLRSFWSIPITIYAFVPQISLLNSFPIFTTIPEDGFSLRVFLFLGAYGKDFIDFVVFGGGPMQRWWSCQRMWLMWGLSSFPFALLEWLLKSLGLSTSGFNVTSKVIEEEQRRLYEHGVFDFGVESVLFFPLTVASIINLFSFASGVIQIFVNGRLEEFFVQMFISGFVVVNSWPIYEGIVLRRDRGRMPLKLSLASLSTAIVIFLASSLVF